MEPWSGCILGLQQPLRLSPTPSGHFGGWHRKRQQLLHRPTMICKPCCHRRGALLSKRAMRPQEVVATANQPHPRFYRTVLVCSGAGPTHQRSQPGPEGGLQALDVSGVDQRQHRSLGRTLLLIGLPRTRANKEEGATTVEEELTGHRTLRTTICEDWRGRPLPHHTPPVGHYVRCANYSWRASTHGFLQKMATWHI